MKLFSLFTGKRLPEVPARSSPDPDALARDLEETEKLHAEAQRQAHTAAVVSSDLRRVNLRNGFAPAIEDSVRRKIMREAT